MKLARIVENENQAMEMQRDVDKLDEWAEKWGMQLNVGKCKVMHLGRKNKRHKLQVQDGRDDTGVGGGGKGPGNMDAQQRQAPYTMRKSGEKSQHGTGHDFEGIPLQNQGYAGTAL